MTWSKGSANPVKVVRTADVADDGRVLHAEWDPRVETESVGHVSGSLGGLVERILEAGQLSNTSNRLSSSLGRKRRQDRELDDWQVRPDCEAAGVPTRRSRGSKWAYQYENPVFFVQDCRTCQPSTGLVPTMVRWSLGPREHSLRLRGCPR